MSYVDVDSINWVSKTRRKAERKKYTTELKRLVKKPGSAIKLGLHGCENFTADCKTAEQYRLAGYQLGIRLQMRHRGYDLYIRVKGDYAGTMRTVSKT